MRKIIHNTPLWLIVTLISLASSIVGIPLVPIIINSPGESYIDITLLVIVPTIIISALVSTPVVYFYRKIISENLNMIEKLQKDHLTGLLNRHTFIERYQQIMITMKTEHKPISLIMLDIDNFKKINDNYGHPAGDAVIIAVATILKEITQKDDLICRFGGEEFLIVSVKMSYEQSLNLGKKLLEALRSSITYDDHMICFTVSIGLAYFEDSTMEPDHYILVADHTMYQAKSMGKNQLVCSRSSVTTTIR